MTAPKTTTETVSTVKGFKGFKKGMVCRGFQFTEGEVFEQPGRVALCDNGFHFCENPFDVLEYYDLINNDGQMNEFASVEAIGAVDSHGNKSATNKIKIGAKLGLPGFIKASFDFLWERTKVDPTPDTVVNTEFRSQVATSGSYSKVATSGDSSQVATSGDSSQVATSGSYSKVATSGDSSQVATSGDSSQVATSGSYSKVATSGDSSQVATSGDSSKVALDSNDSVGAAIGIGNTIKGSVGCWITLAEYRYDYDLERYIPLCVKSAQIDGVLLKADTWYKLSAGEFVEN
jgi:hypothetical protein